MARGKDEVIAPVEPHLTDFFKDGKEVTFTWGRNEVTVWLQKTTPAEDKVCLNKARSARSLITSLKRLPPDHPDRAIFYDQLDEWGFYEAREALADLLISEKLQQYEESTAARLAAESPWSDDDYLAGLQNAWNEGLKDRYYEDPEDAEAKRVFSELKRFTTLVDEEVAAHREDLLAEVSDLSDEEIERRVINRLIDLEANTQMMGELRRWQLYHATRCADDHSRKYFKSREQIDELATEVLVKLIDEFSNLGVSTAEGKDSEETLSSLE